MTFAMPWILALSAIGVVAITVLHLLSVHRPPSLLLPTARFLPDRDIRAVSRSATPNDLLLLVLRIAAIVCTGVALAGPRAPRGTLATLAVVAVEPGVAIDTLDVQRLLSGEFGARRVQYAVVSRDTAAAGPGLLFPLATREAARAVATTPALDSVALIVVQGASVRADSAVPAWRAAWPGRVVYLRVGDTAQLAARRLWLAPRDEAAERDVPRDDVVRAALGWHIARWNGAVGTNDAMVDTVQLVRVRDSARAPAGESTREAITAVKNTAISAAIVVRWPVDGRPSGWAARIRPDTAAAIAAHNTAVLGDWVRYARLDSDSTSRALRPTVWYSDGDAAVVEQRISSGCERTVSIVSNQGSDLLLSPSANGVFDALLAPCAEASPVEERVVGSPRVVARDGDALATAAAFRAPTGDGIDAFPQSWWWRWLPSVLLAGALLALGFEWRVRARQSASAPTPATMPRAVEAERA